jgi:hypothetical protein
VYGPISQNVETPGTGFQPVKSTGWKPVPLRLSPEESRSFLPAPALASGFSARAGHARGNDNQDGSGAEALSLVVQDSIIKGGMNVPSSHSKKMSVKFAKEL